MSTKKSTIKDLEKGSPSDMDKTPIREVKNRIMRRKAGNVLFLLLVIVLLAYSVYRFYPVLKDGTSSIRIPMGTGSATGLDPQEGTLAATVDGQEITMTDLEDRLATVPPQYASVLTEDALLDQMIDELLMLNRAEELGITVDEQEIDSGINDTLTTFGMDEQTFNQELEAQGMDMETFRLLYKKELMIKKLLNMTAFANISISDSDALLYYNEKKDLFTIPEQINASHILICHEDSTSCASNLTKEEALEKINEISQMIDDGMSFEEAAAEYSDCPSSAVGGNLGFFGRGDMVPEFEEAAFNLEPEEVSGVIETAFGYHIIKLYEHQDAEKVDFKLVQDQIKADLESQAQEEAYLDYIASLRDNSDIVKYYP